MSRWLHPVRDASSWTQLRAPSDRSVVDPALQILGPLLIVAIAVSIVHYADNTVNYADYPQPSGGPAPSQGLVAASWFFFTAFGVAGYVLLVRSRVKAAAICLAVYSGSGLVGIGHYTVAGATSMVWWRQTHVVADISCGVAVLVLALWLATRQPALGRDSPRVG